MTDRRDESNTNVLLWALLLGSTFLFYFGVLLYSECGLPDRSWKNIENKRLVQACVLIVSFLFIARHTNDLRARVGALFLAVVGTAPAFPHEDMRSVWRDLPMIFGALLWVPQLIQFMALPLLFSFYALLPRPCFRNAWLWVMVWLPAVILSWWGIDELRRRIYHPENVRDLPSWYIFVVGICVLVYGFGGLIALGMNYLRSSIAERRCLKVLTFGTIASWSPALLFLSAIFLAPFTESRLVWALVVAPFKHIALAMFALVPCCLIYALLRDRVLDLPVINPAVRDPYLNRVDK